MSIQDIVEGKKEWRAHTARVKALPQDYQIVYREIQKYLFKVGPTNLNDGSLGPLEGLVDLFEEGVVEGKGVLEVTGADVATFADGLIEGIKTYDEIYQESKKRKLER